MGNPRNYSAELPARCLQLVNELWPHAQKAFAPEGSELGPLTTTFLMAMSMPIINLPVERILKQSGGGEGYADDRHLNPRITEAVRTIVGNRHLQEAPFYSHGAWSYVQQPGEDPFNVARSLPEPLAEQLSRREAVEHASKLPTSTWCKILRNAMAHGGIAYLDENGRTSFGNAVKMYAFVSTASHPRPGHPTDLRVLRIRETDYRIFLQSWVQWLNGLGLSDFTE